jgi:hypothetical protein
MKRRLDPELAQLLPKLPLRDSSAAAAEAGQRIRAQFKAMLENGR